VDIQSVKMLTLIGVVLALEILLVLLLVSGDSLALSIGPKARLS
jgi:hypothetical protein